MADEQTQSSGSAAAQTAQSSSQSASQSQSAAVDQAASSQQSNQSQGGTTQQAADQQQQAKAERPDWLPESFWDKDKAEPKGADFRKTFDELSAFKAEQDVRRNTLPKSADDYKLELPADFKPPEGIKFELNANDPLLPQARQLMHDIDSGKLSGQEAFSKMVGLYAGAQVQTETMIQTARQAELAKLGPTGQSRVDAVMTWAKAKLGDDMASAFASMLVTAKHVEMGEKLVKIFSGQGSGTFTQQHRDAANREPSDDEWAKMSYSEKKNWQQKRGQSATH